MLSWKLKLTILFLLNPVVETFRELSARSDALSFVHRSLSLSSLRDAVERNTRALQCEVCNVEYLSPYAPKRRRIIGEACVDIPPFYSFFACEANFNGLRLRAFHPRFNRSQADSFSDYARDAQRDSPICIRFVNDSVRAAVKRSRMPTFRDRHTWRIYCFRDSRRYRSRIGRESSRVSRKPSRTGTRFQSFSSLGIR